MAHMWGKWLHHACLLRDPLCLARGENQKGPTSGHSGYITFTFSWVPNAQHGEKIRNSPQVGTVATSPLFSRGSPMPSKGRKSEMAHKWAQWLHHPCLLRDPQCQHGEKIRNGPQVGTVATSPLPSRGFPMPSMGRKSETAHKWARWLHHACLLGDPQCLARGENQKWPTSGHSGCITSTFSWVPNAQHGDKIRNSPQVGTVATSRLSSRGSPMPSKERN